VLLGVGTGESLNEVPSIGVKWPPFKERFGRLKEAVTLMERLWSEDRVTFEGEYYQLREALLMPRPKHTVRIVIGGNGPHRTLGLAAQYADEWNCVYQTPDRFRELSGALDAMLRERNRQPSEVKRTMMTGIILARDSAELERRLAGRSAEQLRSRGALVGSPSELRDQLAELDAAGIQRVMLQWLFLDDFEGIEALGKAVIA